MSKVNIGLFGHIIAVLFWENGLSSNASYLCFPIFLLYKQSLYLIFRSVSCVVYLLVWLTVAITLEPCIRYLSTCGEADFHSPLSVSEDFELRKGYLVWYSYRVRTFVPFVSNITHRVADCNDNNSGVFHPKLCAYFRPPTTVSVFRLHYRTMILKKIDSIICPFPWLVTELY